jgi:hypothetical protein
MQSEIVSIGLLLAAAAVTRVTAVVVLVIVVASGVVARRRAAAAGAALVAVAALGPWLVRSTALAGRPTLVESLAGYNFWLGESADRFGFAPDFGTARERAHRLMTEEAGTIETRTPSFWYGTLTPREAAAFDRRLVGAGARLAAGRPFHYLKRCLAGVAWFWVRAETVGRTAEYAALALPVVSLSLLGLARLARSPGSSPVTAGLLVAVVAVHLAVYAAVCPMARYSVQLYPLMGYLAGVALSPRGAPASKRVADEQPS